MPPFVSLLGRRFGRLFVIERAANRVASDAAARWTCRCDCGNEKVVDSRDLRAGHTQSCGCLRQEVSKSANTRHGHADHRLDGIRTRASASYRAWQAAKCRCSNPRDIHFHLYGGRGIQMCAEWRDDFCAFLVAVGPRPSPELSLDRIDVNGHYAPGNVRWATRSEQARNRRRVRAVNEPVKPLSSKDTDHAPEHAPDCRD